MHLQPRPGHAYRDTLTNQLTPAEGAEFDPANLDVARAIADGDLVPTKAAKAAHAPSAPAAGAKE